MLQITKSIFFSFLLALLATACAPEEKNDTGLYLPEGLTATLWAESPLLFNPTNMDVDAQGRIWVTEAVNYRNFNNDSATFYHHAQGDRIVILEDRDQDGKADTSKVYVQDKDLVSPLGIAVIGNKTIVSCAPNLIIYTDENGDDKPDKKEVLLTGFGGFDHDHSLHCIVAGPDGRWYFNTGNAGPHIVTDRSGWTLRSGSIYTGGTPYNKENQGNMVSDDSAIYVGGLALRMDSDGKNLTVIGHNFRNAYELCVDSYGDVWQNDNDDQVVACRVSWVMEGSNAGYFSEDGTRTWSADQRPGQDMFTAHWHQEDPGVLKAGDNTGAGAPTGVLVYEGDALGEAYRGMFLSADAGRNVVFGYLPENQGAGFRMEGLRKNIVSSIPMDNEGYVWYDEKLDRDTAQWFRPSDLVVGTDGALYIADWYDPVVGGHQMREKKGVGRIYRIHPKGKKLKAPTLDFTTTEGLVEALKNPAVNVRSLATDKLSALKAKAVAPLKGMLDDHNPYHIARALWILAKTGEEGKNTVKAFLKEKNPERLRTTAFRALRLQLSEDECLALCQELSHDPSPMLLRELALTLRKFPWAKAQPIALNLMDAFDGKDPYLLEALGMLVGKNREEIYPLIVQRYGDNADKLFALTWRLHPLAAVDYLKTQGESSDTLISRKAITALAFIPDRKAVEAMVALAHHARPALQEQGRYWLAFRQGNNWQGLYDWKKTTLNLSYEKKKAAMQTLKEKILNPLIDPADRKRTTKKMALDSIGGRMLLGLMANHKLPQDLQQTVSENLGNNPDQRIRFEAYAYFPISNGKPISMDSLMALKGDGINGKVVFAQTCSPCHKVGSTGNSIGPDLSHIGGKFDRASLLEAIVNPGKSLVFGYEAWNISTRDGNTYVGFIEADGKTVILKDLGGIRHTLPAETIVKKIRQEGSIMPTPSALGLSTKKLADIAAYLGTLK